MSTHLWCSVDFLDRYSWQVSFTHQILSYCRASSDDSYSQHSVPNVHHPPNNSSESYPWWPLNCGERGNLSWAGRSEYLHPPFYLWCTHQALIKEASYQRPRLMVSFAFYRLGPVVTPKTCCFSFLIVSISHQLQYLTWPLRLGGNRRISWRYFVCYFWRVAFHYFASLCYCLT